MLSPRILLKVRSTDIMVETDDDNRSKVRSTDNMIVTVQKYAVKINFITTSNIYLILIELTN